MRLLEDPVVIRALAHILAGTMVAGYLGQAAGIIPVLAFQGAAYVLAGLGMLAALRGEGKAEPFPSPVGTSVQPQPTQDAGTSRGRRLPGGLKDVPLAAPAAE